MYFSVLIDEILPATKGYNRQILTAIKTGVSCQQTCMNFLRVAAPGKKVNARI